MQLYEDCGCIYGRDFVRNRLPLVVSYMSLVASGENCKYIYIFFFAEQEKLPRKTSVPVFRLPRREREPQS